MSGGEGPGRILRLPLKEREQAGAAICCRTCWFWDSRDRKKGIGTCHHGSPAYDHESNGTGLWPVTLDDNWCGEWEETS